MYYLGDNSVMEAVALDGGATIGAWDEADDTEEDVVEQACDNFDPKLVNSPFWEA